MKPNQVFTITINNKKYQGKIIYVPEAGWFWKNMDNDFFEENGKIFTDLKYSPVQIQNIYKYVLNYCDDTIISTYHFPWCRTFKDVVKILSYLQSNSRFIYLY